MNAAIKDAIGDLSVRFSETTSLLNFKMSSNGTLLIFQSPRMYPFPEVGFYGYSQEFEKSMMKINEDIHSFDPRNFTPTDLARMQKSSLSMAHFHRVSAEHGLGSDFIKAAELYMAVIELCDDKRISALAYCGLAMIAVRTGDVNDLAALVNAAMHLDPTTIEELHAVRVVALAEGLYDAVYIMAEHVFLRERAFITAELLIFDKSIQRKLIEGMESRRISMGMLCD